MTPVATEVPPAVAPATTEGVDEAETLAPALPPDDLATGAAGAACALAVAETEVSFESVPALTCADATGVVADTATVAVAGAVVVGLGVVETVTVAFAAAVTVGVVTAAVVTGVGTVAVAVGAVTVVPTTAVVVGTGAVTVGVETVAVATGVVTETVGRETVRSPGSPSASAAPASPPAARPIRAKTYEALRRSALALVTEAPRVETKKAR